MYDFEDIKHNGLSSVLIRKTETLEIHFGSFHKPVIDSTYRHNNTSVAVSIEFRKLGMDILVSGEKIRRDIEELTEYRQKLENYCYKLLGTLITRQPSKLVAFLTTLRENAFEEGEQAEHAKTADILRELLT